MLFRGEGRRWLAAGCVCLASFAYVSVASAIESAADRHPPLRSPSRKPAGVPANYVLTHNGFFDPSCVVSLRSDETLGADLVVRGRDGAEHVRFSPCAYPRYSLSGRAIASGAASTGTPPSDSSSLPAHVPHAATYDGWIVSYGYAGRIVSGSSLSTQWVVPLLPANVGDQDIAFFNDIETTAGGEDILQPVLDFSEIPGHWAIESEHCCISGNDEQSTLVEVTPGDLILGVVTAASCDATGACQSWTVTTTDVTTGKSTVLNTTSPMGVPNGVNPGALETYGVMSCDMFPASGEETFTDNVLSQPDGGVETLRYDIDILSSPPAGFVACGYGGSTSADAYTLIFSTMPMTSDAGASLDAGGGMDASVDGSDGGSMDGSADGAVVLDASSDGASSDGASSTALDASADGSEGGSIVDDASVDSSGGGLSDALDEASALGGDSGIAIAPGIDSGIPFDASTFINVGPGSFDNPPDEPGPVGCGCTLAGASGTFAGGPFALLVVAGAWRRRVRARSERQGRAA